MAYHSLNRFHSLQVDGETMRLGAADLERDCFRCPRCGGLARPNVWFCADRGYRVRDELGAVAALRRAAAQTDRQRMRTGKTDIRELWAVLNSTPMLRPARMAQRSDASRSCCARVLVCV